MGSLSYWDWLPAEMQEHVYFLCWQQQMAPVHYEVRKQVNSTSTFGTWLFKGEGSQFWSRRLTWPSLTGWGNEWEQLGADFVRNITSSNKSVVLRARGEVVLLRNSDTFLSFGAMTFFYRDDLKECTRSQEDGKLLRWLPYPEHPQQ